MIQQQEAFDAIQPLLIQWATLTAAVMVLAEWIPIVWIGTTSKTPGKGTRKRYTALIYSLVLSYAAWYGGLLTVPVVPEDGRQIAAVGVLALVSVATAHLVHKAKNKLMK